MIIGADESGTGAWAGPYTVCAVALREDDQERMRELGVRDSKTLTDAARRGMLTDLIDLAVVCHCTVVSVDEIVRLGKQRSWAQAMYASIKHVWEIAPGTAVIDGVKDMFLYGMLRELGVPHRYLPRADLTEPAVSAASVIAKTLRNDAMIRLHAEYPEYGWAINSGYGVPEHSEALKKYGRTIHHRPWKNLIGVPLRNDK
jgi:ribonuclease HII